MMGLGGHAEPFACYTGKMNSLSMTSFRLYNRRNELPFTCLLLCSINAEEANLSTPISPVIQAKWVNKFLHDGTGGARG